MLWAALGIEGNVWEVGYWQIFIKPRVEFQVGLFRLKGKIDTLGSAREFGDFVQGKCLCLPTCLRVRAPGRVRLVLQPALLEGSFLFPVLGRGDGMRLGALLDVKLKEWRPPNVQNRRSLPTWPISTQSAANIPQSSQWGQTCCTSALWPRSWGIRI